MSPIKSEAWALAHGFTHHGRLHGIPIWLTDPEGDLMGPCVQAKNWLFDILLDMGEAVFELGVRLGVLAPTYAIAVGKKIVPGRRS